MEPEEKCVIESNQFLSCFSVVKVRVKGLVLEGTGSRPAITTTVAVKSQCNGIENQKSLLNIIYE